MIKKEYTHAANLYAAMERFAETDSTNGHKIYRGKLTELSRSINLTPAAYSRSLQLLRAMKCVEQLQRGSRHSLSIWAVYFPPTPEAYSEARKLDIAAEEMAILKRLEILEGKVDAIMANIGGLHLHRAMAGLTQEMEEIKKILPKSVKK